MVRAEKVNGLNEIVPGNGSNGSKLEREIGKLGNELWRGDALVVASHTFLAAGETRKVAFMVTPENLPKKGFMSPDTKRAFLDVHIRSRYAHLALDVPEDFTEPLLSNGIGKGSLVKLDISNHGSRPIVLRQADQPLHLFVVPPGAEIKGDSLSAVFGNDIQMFGKRGEDWEKYYELVRDSRGRVRQEFRGVYLRINPDKNKRFWMPESDEPVALPAVSSYREARDLLFKEHFVKESDSPIPQNQLWIGQLPQQKIAPGIYGILSRDAFIKINKQFVKIQNAFQTQSPLLEGRVTEGEEVAHHVEIKGGAEWVLLTYARGRVVVG